MTEPRIIRDLQGAAEVVPADMLTEIEPRRWTPPNWIWSSGMARSRPGHRWVIGCYEMIKECQRDGIERVAPICVAYRARPAEVRNRIGKGAWKRLHHSALHHNALRGYLLMSTKLDAHDVLAIPTGALREAKSMYDRRPTTFRDACSFAHNRTTMREAVMLCADFDRMGGTINRAWSFNRLRREHDALAQEVTARLYAQKSKPWAPSWTWEGDGYTVRLLRSEADFAAEGRAMRHCVASYADRARAGYIDVFRIDGAERATAEFGREGRLRQIKGHCNRDVRGETRRAAERARNIYWLARLAGKGNANA